MSVSQPCLPGLDPVPSAALLSEEVLLQAWMISIPRMKTNVLWYKVDTFLLGCLLKLIWTKLLERKLSLLERMLRNDT